MTADSENQHPAAPLGQGDKKCVLRRTVYFSGYVQGVGFRYTAQAIAARFNVTGFVRNLHDGRVELVVEGPEAELDRFQSAIKQAMHDHIKDAHATNTAATGEFTSFRIAF